MPGLVAEIQEKVEGMTAGELGYCLYAAGVFPNSVPDVLKIVPRLVAEVPEKVQGMTAEDLALFLIAADAL